MSGRIDEPPGRMHDTDVYVDGVGWVSDQVAAELPMIVAAMIVGSPGVVVGATEYTWPIAPRPVSGEVVTDDVWSIGDAIIYSGPDGVAHRCKIVDAEPVDGGAWRYTLASVDESDVASWPATATARRLGIKTAHEAE